jgi:hypothetical protein
MIRDRKILVFTQKRTSEEYEDETKKMLRFQRVRNRLHNIVSIELCAFSALSEDGIDTCDPHGFPSSVHLQMCVLKKNL